MGKVCDIVISGTGQVVIWINTREHRDPHVHCGDKAATWEARFRFSFMTNAVTLWDIRSAKDPGGRVCSEIERQLAQSYVPRCRTQWWTSFQSTLGCCLKNTQQLDAAGRLRQVADADYDPGTNSTLLTFLNGFTRTV